MFNFFKSKPNFEFTDRIWTDGRNKFNGICEEARGAEASGMGVLVIAYFQDTLQTLEEEFRSRGIAFQRRAPLDAHDFCSTGGRAGSSCVWLLGASQLEYGIGTGTGSGDPDLHVIFAEHHPVYSRDHAVLQVAATLPCSSRIAFHTALDDAMMIRFGGERMSSLMATLGQDAETALEHPFISSSIQRAQEKIENKVRNETDASSAEEWFRFNVD